MDAFDFEIGRRRSVRAAMNILGGFYFTKIYRIQHASSCRGIFAILDTPMPDYGSKMQYLQNLHVEMNQYIKSVEKVNKLDLRLTSDFKEILEFCTEHGIYSSRVTLKDKEFISGVEKISDFKYWICGEHLSKLQALGYKIAVYDVPSHNLKRSKSKLQVMFKPEFFKGFIEFGELTKLYEKIKPNFTSVEFERKFLFFRRKTKNLDSAVGFIKSRGRSLINKEFTKYPRCKNPNDVKPVKFKKA